jgi:hypothetical protein
LWPHDLKLQRANQHLNELKTHVRGWVEGDSYTIRVEPDPQPFETDYEVRAYIRWEVREDPFSLLIGDFLQNARAALDYIAFALGDDGAGRGGMPDEVAARAGFPIIGDADRAGHMGRGADLFAAAAAKQLTTVAEPVRTAIERMQPYYVGGEIWMHEPLWQLHELARFDRHRFLHPAVMRSDVVRLDPTSRNVRITHVSTDYGARVIEDPPWDENGTPAGALLAIFTAEPHDPRQEMDMRFLAALQLGFDPDSLPASLPDVLDTMPIDLVLTLIEMKVRSILKELARFLPSGRPF